MATKEPREVWAQMDFRSQLAERLLSKQLNASSLATLIEETYNIKVSKDAITKSIFNNERDKDGKPNYLDYPILCLIADLLKIRIGIIGTETGTTIPHDHDLTTPEGREQFFATEGFTKEDRYRLLIEIANDQEVTATQKLASLSQIAILTGEPMKALEKQQPQTKGTENDEGSEGLPEYHSELLQAISGS